jgi:hypothetical protein
VNYLSPLPQAISAATDADADAAEPAGRDGICYPEMEAA